jgi:hypothetical protein
VLAVAALPAAYVARRCPAVVFAGLLVFGPRRSRAVFAESFGLLVGRRCVQAVGGALVVAAALDLLSEAEGSATGARFWAAAGILRAALGPAAGGMLTETLGWE